MGTMAGIAAFVVVARVTMDGMSSAGCYMALRAILVRNPFVFGSNNIQNFTNFNELSFDDDVKIIAGTFSFIIFSYFSPY